VIGKIGQTDKSAQEGNRYNEYRFEKGARKTIIIITGGKK